MCTLSFLAIHTANGPRRHLAFNRDELNCRGPELPPRLAPAGEHAALWPIDAPSGGSWLGANDRGLAAFLLNADAPYPTGEHPDHSRGDVVPSALHAADVSEAVDTIADLLASGHRNWFRLILIDHQQARVLNWLPAGLSETPLPMDRPWMLTSSSLGDALVGEARGALFAEIFAAELAGAPGSAESLARQRQFHAHQWPDRLELSVNMRRDDASTRSYCELSIDADRLALTYQSSPPPVLREQRQWALSLVKDD